MLKIQGLRAVRTSLQLFSRSVVNRVLNPNRAPLAPVDYDQHIQFAGQAAILLGEVDDHLYYLPLLREACECGIHGTVPEGYEEDGYEGWPEAATPDAPFNAYEAMRLLLGTESTFGVLSLSPALLSYIETLPEQRRRGAMTIQDGEVPMTTTDTGDYRPMTPAEIERMGDKALLSALEEYQFAQTYADDLARVKALVEQRGDLHQILALLE
jgi:hypothetical protein